MHDNLNTVSEAFCTSNAQLSRRLCNYLESMGLVGELASLLFKAEKARKQARNYSGVAVSGRPYRDYSKDRVREMLDDARGRKFDVLVVPDATRISRRPAEVARVVGELRELGIRIALMVGGSGGSSRGIGLSRPRMAFPGIHNCV